MSANRMDTLLVRVYYEDTDFSGVVYHASYLRFLERGRTEFLRQIGFANREMAQMHGIAFAVRSLQIDYFAPAVMDDLLRVQTKVVRVGGASVQFEQLAFRDDQKILVAHVLVAILSAGKPVRIPKTLRDVLKEVSAGE